MSLSLLRGMSQLSNVYADYLPKALLSGDDYQTITTVLSRATGLKLNPHVIRTELGIVRSNLLRAERVRKNPSLENMGQSYMPVREPMREQFKYVARYHYVDPVTKEDKTKITSIFDNRIREWEDIEDDFIDTMKASKKGRYNVTELELLEAFEWQDPRTR